MSVSNLAICPHCSVCWRVIFCCCDSIHGLVLNQTEAIANNLKHYSAICWWYLNITDRDLWITVWLQPSSMVIGLPSILISSLLNHYIGTDEMPWRRWHSVVKLLRRFLWSGTLAILPSSMSKQSYLAIISFKVLNFEFQTLSPGIVISRKNTNQLQEDK